MCARTVRPAHIGHEGNPSEPSCEEVHGACRLLPNSATSLRLSTSLTNVAERRVGVMQHLSEPLPQTGTLPMVRVLSETVHTPPGRTDAVLLSPGMGTSFAYDPTEHAS